MFAGNRPLHLSSSKNHVQIVKFLLEEGVDIEARNKDSETSLIIAANCGHLSVVKYLVGYDANVQRRQSNLKSGRSARGGGGTFLGIYDEPPLLQKPMYIIENLEP